MISWEKTPVVFLLLATVTILVGTIVTMVLPFVWVNTEADRIDSVKPYTPLQLAGRDVYIREGCNNCHTQTVRPLVAEVLRYGDYSKSGEFAFDRPHLWGSRRTGPDLARIGGKYPDAWHLQHTAAPKSMVPRSNMPAYAFLASRTVDPADTRHKMEVLGFPFREEEIAGLQGKTEMDALVAYLQKLGGDIPWRQAAQTVMVGELHNPFQGDSSVLPQGEALYREHCAGCHGADMRGGIAADIADVDMPDADLYALLYNGLPDAGMPGFSALGSDRLWKLVNFVKYHKRH
jgi:cytochrome c oxidase cbb3-type subunit 2